MARITLILNRIQDDLWLDTEEGHFMVLNDVSGVNVECGKGDDYPVSILRHGKRVGMVWYVKTIEERWK